MTDKTAEHERYIRRCLELAQQAIATGDTPVGSLIVDDAGLVAEGVEAVRATEDVTAHAEIVALRAAFATRGARDLTGCTLYTSVEPCVMCAYAIRLARIRLVVSGARSGTAENRVVDDVDSGDLITGFAVLTNAALLPRHPVPAIIRDVLADRS